MICNTFINKLRTKYINHITISNYIIERLLYKNINKAFGYNGGAALPLFDAISKSNKFEMIFNRHEQSSGHCAEAYSKITNNIGTVITTSGPGFTNVITPLQDAYSDSIPLLCISCQVSSKVLGTHAFQESNTIGISKACVKWNYQIKGKWGLENFPMLLEHALNVCEQPRKGPVHLDICKDLLIGTIRLDTIKNKRYISTSLTKSEIKLKELKIKIKNLETKRKFKELEFKIKNSKKPVLIAGAGAINDYKELRKFIEKYNIPTTTTLHGLGTINEESPLALKMLGMHGSYEANMVIQNADLIIGLGNRYDDRTIGKLDEFAPEARKNGGIIHIDNSYNQILKVESILKPNLSIHCSSSEVLNYLNNCTTRDIMRADWFNSINKWRKVFRLNRSNELTSNYVISTLSKILKDTSNYILTTGVGSHQMVTAQYFTHRFPNKLLTSGSLGTMGVGLPFAIGAQIAKPDSKVILIDGDGSFTMSINEIASIKEYNLPIKIFIMNDKKLQMVDYWQELLYDNNKTGSQFKYTPEFDKIADTFKIKNYICDSKASVYGILEEVIEYPGPVLVNFMIDKSYCLPFVPPETALNKMVMN